MTSLWMDLPDGPTTSQWRDGASYDVVVVGAGITGLATAYLLARRGMSVAVLEARHVGAVTTGNTTGKVSLLQGTSLSLVRSHAGAAAARTYVEANRAGQEWLVDELGEGDVLQVRDAWTYAVTRAGRQSAAAEWQACREAGLPVEAVQREDTGLPFPAVAVRLPGQAQVHAGLMLQHLVRKVLEAGGVVLEGQRVTGIEAGTPVTVHVDRGTLPGGGRLGATVAAGRVILATGTPILDRRMHFSRLEPLRSYGSAYRVPGALPPGMYLSSDTPSRSLRTAPADGEEFLVVGGNGHPVGRPDVRGLSPRDLVKELDAWTTEHFPGAERTHVWSAQDYRSPDGIPYVGPLGGTEERILLATGFNKWGMTNGAAAALALAGHVVGQVPEWAGLLTGRGVGVARAKEMAVFNAQVAARLTGGYLQAGLSSAPDTVPEGHGVVGRDGVRPVAVCTVDGVTRKVSGVCPHLGGILEWNDAELSWDCPLHGSRFAADGSLLEGPATRDVRPG